MNFAFSVATALGKQASFMGPAGIALLLGIPAIVGGLVGGISQVGDLGMDPNGGPVVSSPTMGGVFQGKKGDGLSMGPTFGSGGGSSTNIDTSGIERGTQQTTAAVNSLIAKFETAFGFGGTVAGSIGNKVGDKLVTNL